MKPRYRMTALLLSVMLVLSMTLSGLTVYADSADTTWNRKNFEENVDSWESEDFDGETAIRVTASDPEKKEPSSSKTDITGEELYRMSDEGLLTKAVMGNLGQVNVNDEISIREHLQFICLGDDPEHQEETDLTEYVTETYGDTVKSGSLEKNVPKSFRYNEHDHMYVRATVGNTPVYYAGILQVDGVDYVYYVTDRENNHRSVYTILRENERINICYVHKTAYPVTYSFVDLETASAEGPEGWSLEEVFGNHPTEVVEDGGSYTFQVTIPRGYEAEVLVYSGDRTVSDVEGSDYRLGSMLQYQRNGNKITLKSDSPSKMLLTGTYTINHVTADQRVVVQYNKLEQFEFNKDLWNNTVYANGRITWDSTNEYLITDHRGSVSFDAGSTWEMDQLQINGETIKVPMMTMDDHGEQYSETTTLATGTIIKVSVEIISGTAGSKRHYTVGFENCYENLTISSGNMVGHTHREIAVHSLNGVKDPAYYTSNKDNAGGSWNQMSSSTLIDRKTTNYYSDPFAVARKTAYGKPEISVSSKEGKTILQKNGQSKDSNRYIEYLILKDGVTRENLEIEYKSERRDVGNVQGIAVCKDSNFESVSYENWEPSADGYYYFRYTKAVDDFMKTSNNGVVLLDINAQPTKVGVDYVSGEGKANGPATGNVVNMPSFDNGGETGYNAETNPHVPIASTVPRDVSGIYEFDHWTVLQVNSDGSLGEPKEGTSYATGQSAHLTEDSYVRLADCYRYDTEKDRVVFTMQAVWKKADVETPIDYSVHYFLDGKEIAVLTHTANKGATVISDLYTTDAAGKKTISESIRKVLGSGNYGSVNGSGRYIIDDEKSTKILKDIQPDNNTINIYLLRADRDLSVKKQWRMSDLTHTIPITEIKVQLQRRVGTEEDWENAGAAISLAAADAWEHAFTGIQKYREDDPKELYTYRVVELDPSGTVVENGGKLILDSQTFLVNYQIQEDTWTILNAETPTGAIEISNSVSGRQGDTEKKWSYTMEDLSDTKLDDGEYGGMSFNSGKADFTLKDGESIVAVGLPVGHEFRITENEANGDGYLSYCGENRLGSDGSTVLVVKPDTTVTASFLNVKDIDGISVYLEARKFVNRKTPSNAQKYHFALKDQNGRLIQRTENKGEVVSFEPLDLTEQGTYRYYIVEENEGTAGVQYDDSVYQAEIIVTENHEESGATFSAAVSYQIPGALETVKLPEFQNTVSEQTLTSVMVKKIWEDENSADRPEEVRFQLYRDGDQAEGEPVTVRADADGNWIYVWENLDNAAQWSVQEVEIPDGYEAETPYVVGNEWTITNRLKQPDPPSPISITVKIVWDDDGSEKRPSEVPVQLYKDGVPYEQRIVTAEENWTYTWKDLEDGASWTLDETPVPDGYTRTIDSDAHVYTLTNKIDSGEQPGPSPVVPEKTSVTVNKVWEDGNRADRPDHAVFQLYRDGEIYGEAVSVSEKEGWRHVWNDLETGHTWIVKEIDIPEQYTSSGHQDGTVWTFTNTIKLPDPEHSGGHSGRSDSDSDTDYDRNMNTSGKPDQTERDQTKENTVDRSDSSSTEKTSQTEKRDESWVKEQDRSEDQKIMIDSDTPQTGDETHRNLWLLLMGLSAAGIFTVVFYGEKEKRRRDNR